MVMTQLMGPLLAALAAQQILNGVTEQFLRTSP
jgi:small neutral amino acid transporter SnatA (MarC family)